MFCTILVILDDLSKGVTNGHINTVLLLETEDVSISLILRTEKYLCLSAKLLS